LKIKTRIFSFSPQIPTRQKCSGAGKNTIKRKSYSSRIRKVPERNIARRA